MSNLAIINKTEAITDAMSSAADSAANYAEQAKASNTVRGYQADWSHFTRWCGDRRVPSMPASPETVACYVSELAATHKPATLTRRLSAISQAHQLAGFTSPTSDIKVRVVMQGIRKAKGVAPIQKTPALTADVAAMLRILPDSLIGVRDAALLLIGFGGAFRRSELVSLDVSDIDVCDDGLVINLRRSKTDQSGKGEKKAIHRGRNANTCPVRSFLKWKEFSSITSGPVFRSINRHGHLSTQRLSDRAVAEIVKRSASAAGFNPALYAGHSLRSGLATSAASAGCTEHAIMRQTGHRSVAMVRRYIRDGNLFRNNVTGDIGL